MKPDASTHNPSPDYLRKLIDRTDMTRDAVAARLGVSRRTLFNYLERPSAPYTFVFALEALAKKAP